ncbi:hypothetical protein [Photobacterium iliopiscarium]|jgi:hypothetical protein|uniref:hypothetical protein n=1 Tax=Photobacterium iliopiscarium TaxID=56192 RepID=UPI001E3B9BA3|nr:hypothetical protein [Photobacterium iliopiscarium]MCD9467341.1 hypothetical protein [Photobacterium iliopiscarium]MCD9488768.1 hypothetical protein [Photobacterium iliopiscarium]MCF2245482.1 hypothetical protein [Photobacterium iliopiscarium]
MTEEYKKSCRDELDWNAVEQLHESTLQISNSCFEFKKLCVGLIGIIVAALIKFDDNGTHILVFILPLIISIGFWICDSTAYYYQKKNRSLMNKTLNGIAARNQATGDALPTDTPQWKQALFNPSMALYYYISIACLIGLHVQILIKI